MRNERYITSLKEKKQRLINEATQEYQKILEAKQNGVNFYRFNIMVDDLGDTILDIINSHKALTIASVLGVSEAAILLIVQNQEKEQERYIAKLLADKKGVTKAIELIDSIIATIGEDITLMRLKNGLEFFRFKEVNELEAINKEIRKQSGPPDLTDNELDIYLDKSANGVGFRATIYLHNNKNQIGFIDYRGPVDSEWLGDIGYGIEEQHQGHNYAYKALKLVSRVIKEQGIESVVITTYNDNIPSQKTIEKFGGIRIDCTLPRVLRYKCPIKDLKYEDSIQSTIHH